MTPPGTTPATTPPVQTPPTTDPPVVAAAEVKPPEVDPAKAAADKVEADKKAVADAEKAKNDTKVTPLKLDEIKLPEGFDADKPLQEKFVALVNEHGIPRNAVPALVALQADALKAASEANSALWNKTQEEWQAQSKADPEIGGDKLAPNLTLISKFVDHYGGTKLREALDLTGAGNHPEIIKAFAKAAKDLGEPHFVSGDRGTQPVSQADRMFGPGTEVKRT